MYFLARAAFLRLPFDRFFVPAFIVCSSWFVKIASYTRLPGKGEAPRPAIIRERRFELSSGALYTLTVSWGVAYS